MTPDSNKEDTADHGATTREPVIKRENSSSSSTQQTNNSIDEDLNKHEGKYCFITTACTHARGLPDDCLELKTLRALRDNYVLKIPEGKQLWKEYKTIAPKIIDAINTRNNPKEIYEMIFTKYIQPITQIAIQGKSREALNQYQEMTRWLQNEFLPQKIREPEKSLSQTVLLHYITKERRMQKQLGFQ